MFPAVNVPEEVKAIEPVAGVVHVTLKGPPVIEPVVIVFVEQPPVDPFTIISFPTPSPIPPDPAVPSANM